ncbi:hypothetical protein L228DRAFT_135187 [Xylona heveae TC161]|uniref:Pentatricopeptide repeat protein n=1 Tax=Xylona heveae (strain CBS 132557 / TC161) TaxID=1328760 RepID=A0A165GY06_XYLHT|nr:hypothetical protein L228DRAFT_135187 [Xylona heveae TC161]KZF22745.1 hypothetical protein L228DRAFT_135187 [Xylona heveae TC161]
MAPCSGCLSRYLRAIVSLQPQQAQRIGQQTFRHRTRIPQSASLWSQRSYATAGTATVERTGSRANDGAGSSKADVSLQASRSVQLDLRPAWKQQGKRAPTIRGAPSPRELQRRISFMKDPLVLADYVRKAIERGQWTTAVETVRLASKQMSCTVSWNHLINEQFVRGRGHEAFRIYNEMKKRGQTPDSHTYTLLLRGFADLAMHPYAVGRALSIYHSLYAPNSPIKPSIIHTNAVLKVCARANDMDSLWGVAAKLPEQGRGAPDNMTWTTILNAVRQSAIKDAIPGEPEETGSRRREKAILEGKKMWEDIVSNWRQGNLRVDEELVGAMGRLLLIGSRPKDWDSVLSLIEQTMDIPRLAPRLGTSARPSIPVAVARSPATETSENEAAQQQNEEEESIGPNGTFAPPDAKTALSRAGRAGTSGRNQAVPLSFAKPTSPTLSLLLQACIKMRAKQLASHYWDLLTDPTGYGIQPDAENIHNYLRIMRLSRSSRDAVALVDRYMIGRTAKVQPTRKTFRIAMSACARDKINPRALDHASELLLQMLTTIEEPDIRTLISYVDLANESAASKDGQVVLNTLSNLNPAIVNIRSFLAYGGHVARQELQASTKGPRSSSSSSFSSSTSLSTSSPLAQQVDKQTKEDALELVRKLISSYDRLLNNGMVPREKYGDLHKERSKLAAFHTRYGNHPGQASWRKKKEEKQKLRDQKRGAKARVQKEEE